VPQVIVGLLVLVGAYLVVTGSRNRTPGGAQVNPVTRGQRVRFILGALTILIALNPPLDDWSGHYLLFARMI